MSSRSQSCKAPFPLPCGLNRLMFPQKHRWLSKATRALGRAGWARPPGQLGRPQGRLHPQSCPPLGSCASYSVVLGSATLVFSSGILSGRKANISTCPDRPWALNRCPHRQTPLQPCSSWRSLHGEAMGPHSPPLPVTLEGSVLLSVHLCKVTTGRGVVAGHRRRSSRLSYYLRCC